MYTSKEIDEKVTVHKDFTNETLTQEKFLFISADAYGTAPYHEYYSMSLRAKDFAEAKKQILADAVLPNLITIDMPLNHIQLVEFKVWLTAKHLHKIPVIYNEACLSNDHIQTLFSQKLVDDVVNLGKHYTKLPYKARFIQRLNNEMNITVPQKADADSGSLVLRGIDMLISGIAILCLLPVFIAIAIAVKLESKGPAFYSSLRAGKGFKIFKFYKFRTMVQDADKKIKELADQNLYAGTDKKVNFFKIKNDPRITRLGAFLRNSSLDELPQLFNVFKGDMSIVGNRPLPLYEAATLTTDEWAERFMAPAGITGLWQILKRGKSEMSNEERIFLDIDYARNRTFKGDLKILIQTPAALIQKSNV